MNTQSRQDFKVSDLQRGLGEPLHMEFPQVHKIFIN